MHQVLHIVVQLDVKDMTGVVLQDNC